MSLAHVVLLSLVLQMSSIPLALTHFLPLLLWGFLSSEEET